MSGNSEKGENNQVNFLSTWLKEKEEKIQELLHKLTEESEKGTPIIVEGKKDANTLYELGISGKILTIKTGGKSFLETALEIEKLEASEVILLLDFDRRGMEGTRRLKKDLERTKTKVNMLFWLELRSLVGRDICCIESLTSYLSTLKSQSPVAK